MLSSWNVNVVHLMQVSAFEIEMSAFNYRYLYLDTYIYFEI